MSLSKLLVAGLALTNVVDAAKSLKDIKHVIMFMQENRSFQHYFGTMAGVRGFADPNVQVNPDGRSVWYQNVTGLTDKADWLLPYWLNHADGTINSAQYNKSQCLCAGANNWIPTQQILADGLLNKWAQLDDPQSWGYFKRQDIPFHYALADAYTVGDAYHSGTINVPGGKTPLGAGGVILDNNQVNGCTGTDLDCLPLKWPAYAQLLDEAGVDWRSYQSSYNWATNSGLFYFEAFQNSAKDSSLYKRGLAFDGENGLQAFKDAAANGTLPEVSWVFPPGALQEHSPQAPNDGAWFMNELVYAAINGKNRDDTVMLINYDEAGGWGDAVYPLISPEGTPGEWFEDPYGSGYTFSGPGIRIPLMIISPYTRGGKVFTERGDHSSILMFLEEYLTAKGYSNVTADQLSDWRREHMSNLVNAFDFDNPDYSIPNLPKPSHPMTDSSGNIIGLYSALCAVEFSGSCSGSNYAGTIPYGTQTEEDALFFEDGSKQVRGYLTEGRYLVFESNGHALHNPGTAAKQFDTTVATAKHENIQQRWYLEPLAKEGSQFYIRSAFDGKYISQHSSLSTSVSGAQVYNITYIGSSQYTLQKENGDYLNIQADGSLSFTSKAVGYEIFSVTYHS